VHVKKLGVFVSLAAVAATVPTAAGTSGSASRVIDRTIQCTPGWGHGAFSVTVSAQSGWKKDGKFEWPGQFAVATPGQPLPKRKNYMPQLLGLTTGFPINGPRAYGGVGYSGKLCKISHAPVALTRRALTGGEAGLFGDEYKCLLSGPVVIRFRAVFFEPTTLKPLGNPTFYSAAGRIDKAQVAVRTTGGKRLAYGEALDSGKARLFTSGRCT
jgi:hypothetical protein